MLTTGLKVNSQWDSLVSLSEPFFHALPLNWISNTQPKNYIKTKKPTEKEQKKE